MSSTIPTFFRGLNTGVVTVTPISVDSTGAGTLGTAVPMLGVFKTFKYNIKANTENIQATSQYWENNLPTSGGYEVTVTGLVQIAGSLGSSFIPGSATYAEVQLQRGSVSSVGTQAGTFKFDALVTSYEESIDGPGAVQFTLTFVTAGSAPTITGA